MAAYESRGESDEWYTPPHVFEALGCRFDMDVASPEDRTFVTVPANDFVTPESPDRDWCGFIWMNPPFGHQATKRLWLRRFFDHGNGIALTPDRTSALWFREAWSRAGVVMFTPKLKFIRPDGSIGEQPGTGTVLWAAGDQAVLALQQAANAGLGILAAALPASTQDEVRIP